MFHALDKSINATNLQPDTRFVGPAIVDAFQKIVEEALLQEPAIIRIEMRPVL